MKTLINGMKYSWCYALALCYREMQGCISIPDSISIGSAVLAQLMVVFNTQTTPATSVTIGRICAFRARNAR